MKKFIALLIILIITCLNIYAEESIINAGISIDEVPKALFGSWRVIAKLEETNSYKTFKPQSIDMWNLTRVGNVITLDNPFTHAKAGIKLNAVEGNLVVFTKKAPYDNKILTDTVTIRLSDGKFSGINTLSLEYYSLVDNHLMKTETARYIIKGEKIAGENILQK